MDRPMSERRRGVISAMDFRRFGRMRAFDNKLVYNALNGITESETMSRMEYAVLIRDSMSDDDLSEAVKKKKMEAESEMKKRKQREAEFEMKTKKREADFVAEIMNKKKTKTKGEFESEKNKTKGEVCDSGSEKKKASDGESRSDVLFKAFMDTFKGLPELKQELGDEALEAESEARMYEAIADNRARHNCKDAQEAAARALFYRKEADDTIQYLRKQAAAKALDDAKEATALNFPIGAAVKTAQAKLNSLIKNAQSAAKVLDDAKQAVEAATRALDEARQARALNEARQANALNDVLVAAAEFSNEAQEAPAKVRRSTRISNKVASYIRPLLV